MQSAFDAMAVYPLPEEQIAKELPADAPIAVRIEAYKKAVNAAISPAGQQALAAYCNSISISETPASHVSDLYKELAGLEAAAGQYTEAEEHLRLALQFDPKSTPAYCELAKLFEKEKRTAEAVELLKAALVVPGTDSIHKSIIRDWIRDLS